MCSAIPTSTFIPDGKITTILNHNTKTQCHEKSLNKKSQTFCNPSQNRWNTAFIFPPFSIDMMRMWSSSFTHTRKFFSSLCLKVSKNHSVIPLSLWIFVEAAAIKFFHISYDLQLHLLTYLVIFKL